MSEDEVRLLARLRAAGGALTLASLGPGARQVGRRLVAARLAHVDGASLRRGPAPPVISPPTPSRPPSGVPDRPGFYWARWCVATGKEAEGILGGRPTRHWEVVEVFWRDECDSSDEWWWAYVPGIRDPQPVEDFHWGPGPLPEPGA